MSACETHYLPACEFDGLCFVRPIPPAVLPDAGVFVYLVRAGYDAEGVDGFCRGEGWLDDMEAEVYVEADKVR